ncbi:hypothetical protein PENVUL_c130G03302 [Penicillium vulpinum]|uniref:Uncharacterized protein n=1 Tax=Penicillium vulpinum TaxID=29845 RepID=A0A1V6R045_9EURO|nr:hypothetical protein PENVUL_c130G03302 [Penicillium vulpinum]
MQFSYILFGITTLLATVVTAAPAEAGKSDCGRVCYPKDHKCSEGLHLKGVRTNSSFFPVTDS